MRKAELHTLGHITGKLQQLVLRVVHNHRKLSEFIKERCTITFELDFILKCNGTGLLNLPLVVSVHHDLHVHDHLLQYSTMD